MDALKRVAKSRGIGKSEAYREWQRNQSRKRHPRPLSSTVNHGEPVATPAGVFSSNTTQLQLPHSGPQPIPKYVAARVCLRLK